MVGIAQLVRAPGCGPGGHGFDSHYSPHIKILDVGVSPSGKARDFDSRIRRFEPFHPSQKYGPLAQSVEHLTFNQVVPRSIRGWITKHATVAELADAPDLGSGISDVGVQVSSVAPKRL